MRLPYSISIWIGLFLSFSLLLCFQASSFLVLSQLKEIYGMVFLRPFSLLGWWLDEMHGFSIYYRIVFVEL